MSIGHAEHLHNWHQPPSSSLDYFQLQDQHPDYKDRLPESYIYKKHHEVDRPVVCRACQRNQRMCRPPHWKSVIHVYKVRQSYLTPHPTPIIVRDEQARIQTSRNSVAHIYTLFRNTILISPQQLSMLPLTEFWGRGCLSGTTRARLYAGPRRIPLLSSPSDIPRQVIQPQ